MLTDQPPTVITVTPSYQMRHLVLAAAGLACQLSPCPCRPYVRLDKPVSLVKAPRR